MARNKKKKDEEKPKKSEFKAFLKKRAPIYLGIIALFVAFVIPELTESNLTSSLPEMSPEDQQVVDILMGYNGPNESGLTVKEALEKKISEEYPDEKIFNNKKTTVDLTVTNIDAQKYKVVFNFQSHKGEINYDWNVDVGSGKITGNDPASKHIIDLVDFYD